jgi:hypothetical protein
LHQEHLFASVPLRMGTEVALMDRLRLIFLGSPMHVVNPELQGFLTSLEPVLAVSPIHAQTRNKNEWLNSS